jgi:sulfur carrier protein ThiS adenylyltransferase
MAGWGNSNRIRCRKLDETLYVCGDESSEISDDLPPLAPGVGIVANMQADVVIEILLKKT